MNQHIYIYMHAALNVSVAVSYALDSSVHVIYTLILVDISCYRLLAILLAIVYSMRDTCLHMLYSGTVCVYNIAYLLVHAY
jgi:hypothetical protein